MAKMSAKQKKDLNMIGGLVAGSFLSEYALNLVEQNVPMTQKAPYVAPLIVGAASYYGYTQMTGKKQELARNVMLGILADAGGDFAQQVIPSDIMGMIGDIVDEPFKRGNRTVQNSPDGTRISNV